MSDYYHPAWIGMATPMISHWCGRGGGGCGVKRGGVVTYIMGVVRGQLSSRDSRCRRVTQWMLHGTLEQKQYILPEGYVIV